MTNSHGNIGTPMVISTAQHLFQNFVSIPSFKQRSLRLFRPYYFFIKLQFPSIFPWLSVLKLIYSPHYITFSGNCIPVSSGSDPRFTWTSSNHVLLHVSQRAGKSGGSSTRWHGLSSFLKPQKPLGTPSWDQGLGKERDWDYPPKNSMGKQVQKTTSVIYLHVHFCFHTVCVHSSGTSYGQELLEAQLHLIISTWGSQRGQAAGKKQVVPAWIFLASWKCLWAKQVETRETMG